MHTHLSLSGQHVAVIGGGAGMGLGIARAASAAGARVTIGGRTLSKLEAALPSIGELVWAHTIDIMDDASVRDFFNACGTVDHLAIPASSVRTGPFKETSLADIEFSFRSKVLGPALCVRHAQLKETGSVVFFSGILAQRPGNSSWLGSVNAAVETLAKGLAVELAPIRVNVVSPGMTEGTEAYAKMPNEAREAMFAGYREKLPVRRVGNPQDMGVAALSLMSNGFITGQVLAVDGGGLLT